MRAAIPWVPLDRTIRRILAWWLGELAEMLPARLRPAGASAVTVGIAADGFTVGIAAAKDGWRLFGQTAVADELPQILRSAGLTANGSAVLRLEAGQALRRDLSLPRAAEADLAAALAFQIDRFTPFRAEEAHYGFLVRRREADVLAIELAVAPRALVRDLVERLHEAGVTVRGVAVGGGHPDIPLFAATEAGAASPFRGGPLRGLTALAVALAVADLAVPLVRERVELTEAQAAMEQARTEAKAGAAVRDAVDRERRQLLFAWNRRHASPTMEAVVAELTHLTPDGTWVSELIVADGSVQISGSSASANGMVGALEQSGMFAHAGFRSPVTREPNGGEEHFQVSAYLSQGGGG